ncbi:MAG: hypothetical protein GQ474_04150 [Sulfurimonas sp.]|nr:hypothetical protein [Sulfurimonas sp.]
MKKKNKNIKELTSNYNNVEEKVLNLHKLLLSMNAYGSLGLNDFKMIEDYLKGAFDISNKLEDNW